MCTKCSETQIEFDKARSDFEKIRVEFDKARSDYVAAERYYKELALDCNISRAALDIVRSDYNEAIEWYNRACFDFGKARSEYNEIRDKHKDNVTDRHRPFELLDTYPIFCEEKSTSGAPDTIPINLQLNDVRWTYCEKCGKSHASKVGDTDTWLTDHACRLGCPKHLKPEPKPNQTLRTTVTNSHIYITCTKCGCLSLPMPMVFDKSFKLVEFIRNHRCYN